MPRTSGCAILTLITLALFGSAEISQTTRAQPSQSQESSSKQTLQKPQDRIVIDTKLVNLTVSVNDKLGRFVTGLTKEDFEVFDDAVKQEIALFSDDDAPISLGIVYDVSGSMGGFSSRSLAMLRQFFENSHKEDEFYVFAFNNRVHLVQDFTALSDELVNRVAFIKAKGNTALYDAIYAAVRLIELVAREQKSPRALLADVPPTSITPELRVDCPDAIKFQVVRRVLDHFKSTHPVLDVDGARIDFGDGAWGLCRASNTGPVLVLRFEARDDARRDAIHAEVESVVKRAMGELER